MRFMGVPVWVVAAVSGAILLGDGPFLTTAASWSYLGYRYYTEHAEDYAWKTRPMGVAYYA